MRLAGQILLRVAITLALAACLYLIRYVMPYTFMIGADGWFMYELIEKDPFPLYIRSLLTVLIHKGVYGLVRPFGLDGWYAIALSSSLAGGIAIQALWAMKKDWLFLAINILSGSFFVFVGHVENYAWVNAFFLLMLWWLLRWLEEDASLWPAMVFFTLACLSHLLALFYIPALAYLFWRCRRYNPLELILPVLFFSWTVILLSLFFQVMGMDNGLERLVPLFEKWAPNQNFTFFSWAHWKMLAYFHHKAAFLWIPIELPLLFLLRRRIRTLYLRFLLACVICGLIWTTVWHPDWSEKDWDLFSQFGIPLHVLLGFLICGVRDERIGRQKALDSAQSG